MSDSAGVIVIGWQGLVLATAFVVFVGALSVRLSLGLERDLAVASVRTYAQLLALGVVLKWVFAHDSWYLVVAILFLMTLTAAQIVVKQAPDAPAGIWWSSFISMFVTGTVITFAVTAGVVGVDPWYRAQYVVPLAGMVLGNSMNGIALALERLYRDLDLRAEEVLALTALGATPWEAAHGSVRDALRAGLIPTINSMAAVGIVFIPGMMAGQVLAGADPFTATGYQIVVMLMVAAATALGSVLALYLTYRKRFSETGIFLEPGLREPSRLLP